MQPYNLQSGFELLKRLNKVKVNGRPISMASLPDSDAAVWQRFQQYLLFTDIPAFLKSSDFNAYANVESGRQQWVGMVKSFFAFLGVIFLSFIGVCVLAVRRPKNLVFSSDKISENKFRVDFRLSPVYEAFRNTKADFFEVIHGVPGMPLFLNAFRRGRPVIYLEAIDGMWYFWRAIKSTFIHETAPVFAQFPEGSSEDERQFMRYVVTKYTGTFPLIAFRIKVLKYIFRLSAFHNAFMIDDTRHYHEVAEALRMVEVPSFAVQHGHFTKYHVGWLMSEEFSGLRPMRPDTLLVWSDFWKNEIQRLGSVFPDSSIRVGGLPKAPHEFKVSSAPSKDILVLIPHETDSPKNEIVALLGKISLCKGVRVYFKLRPDVPVEETLAQYPPLPDSVSVIRTLDELPRAPDLVLGVYSTFLYESVSSKVPVAVVSTSTDYGGLLVRSGLADTFSADSNVCGNINHLAHLSSDELERRASLLRSEKRIVDTIAGIL